MNLLVPFGWIKEFLTTQVDAVEFAKATTRIGNSVERMRRLEDTLRGVVVGRVVDVQPHSNADALRVCIVDVGEKKPLQIVCGGQNVAAGMVVAVARVGAHVLWHGADEAVIEPAVIRGEHSEGMICAPEEIGFAKLSAGERMIWDIGSVVLGEEAHAGTPLAKALGLQDEIVFDIEVTTNRPDAMSVVGQAREAYAASLGEMRDAFLYQPELPEGSEDTQKEFTLQVDEPELCSRYLGLVLDVEVSPSPWWMQKHLLLAGAKPINNVVDVTNYVRLEFGQPLHAFDYDKLEGKRISVRRAKKGEAFEALDDSRHILQDDMVVIADAKRPVALAGIMGSKDSGVTVETKTIVLEAATFDALSIRKTARALNLASDSQQLYEKGLSRALPAYGMARAVELLKRVAKANVVSTVFDSEREPYVAQTQRFHPSNVNALIGVTIEADIQHAILERLGFRVATDSARVTTPFWRDHDIEADVDLTEEIARVYGFDNLPDELPKGVIPHRERDTLLDREGEIKDVFSSHGWTELYANSFVDPDDVQRAGMDVARAMTLANPLSKDESVMRTSLVPTMLKTIAQEEHTNTVLRLFELQRVYLPREGELPEERSMLVACVTDAEGGENLFRHAKGMLGLLSDRYHVTFELTRDALPHWVHAGRAARILVYGTCVGTVGEVHPMLQKAFGLECKPALLELDLPNLEPHLRMTPIYREPDVFPSAYRDLAFLTDESVDYERMERAVREATDMLRRVELFDVYRDAHMGPGKKSFALHLAFGASDHTLSADEIHGALAGIMEHVQKTLGAVVRE
ncbi:phenylalanine--tRNA ligase subunit beta [Candidatus Uhrbacteria bacterium]|nr:phenylalanine--tRNA ligase subunit beta [Candidatus Uhrbacteria bacterium]